jgi:hypothetical protein
MNGVARCWARLKNWMHDSAPEVLVTPSDHSIRRVNFTFQEQTFSVDIYDLLNVLRDMQHIRATGDLPPGFTADLTPSQIRVVS